MLNVLIVDDMDIVRREIKRLRVWGESTGFVILEEASNGQEALEILEQKSMDLVITDIKMPKINGLELLEKIMEKDLCPCVVLLSDYTDFTYTRQGIILGAFDYMSKPVCEEEFKKLLHRAKKHIIVKSREKEKLKNLRKNLEEIVEVFFSDTEVKQIAHLIEHGDMEYIEALSRMLDRIEVHLDFEFLKIERALRKVFRAILDNIIENKKWLEKFIHSKEIDGIDFLNCKDIRELREAFMDKIKSIFDLLDQLYCTKTYNDTIVQICDCVLKNSEDKLSLTFIAEKLYMHKNYISEVFKQKTGMSIKQYLTRIKMERAKVLIAEGRLKIYEISDMLGYKDVEYFSKIFKKYTGMTPSQFNK
ncbi:response regulator [Defluviitalea raffinosedens]|uniref:response regulator n=1 Tax=Defluviitalea raffinosedens TaxID=1450156 RepID=UPI001956BBCD|nr:two-component system response regulator YesN [Defluviitalea raffinosedens]